MEEFLKETSYLDFSNKEIQTAVKELTQNLQTNREKAIAIHDFVRENIKFGFNRKFYDLKASEVFKTRIGFCNNKSGLFVSMLRCVGIPSRLVFVDMNKNVLMGIVDPRTDYVDHSYAEVYLDDKWIKVDSYIVDSQLFNKAKLKLSENGSDMRLGYGIHRDGSDSWDGENDSFSQFVYTDAENISTKEYGIYQDVNQFYESTPATWNKSNVIQNMVFLFFSGGMNKNVEKIRKET